MITNLLLGLSLVAGASEPVPRSKIAAADDVFFRRALADVRDRYPGTDKSRASVDRLADRLTLVANVRHDLSSWELRFLGRRLAQGVGTYYFLMPDSFSLEQSNDEIVATVNPRLTDLLDTALNRRPVEQRPIIRAAMVRRLGLINFFGSTTSMSVRDAWEFPTNARLSKHLIRDLRDRIHREAKRTPSLQALTVAETSEPSLDAYFIDSSLPVSFAANELQRQLTRFREARGDLSADEMREVADRLALALAANLSLIKDTWSLKDDNDSISSRFCEVYHGRIKASLARLNPDSRAAVESRILSELAGHLRDGDRIRLERIFFPSPTGQIGPETLEVHNPRLAARIIDDLRRMPWEDCRETLTEISPAPIGATGRLVDL